MCNYPEFEFRKNSVEENLKFFNSFYKFSSEKLWGWLLFYIKIYIQYFWRIWKENSTKFSFFKMILIL